MSIRSTYIVFASLVLSAAAPREARASDFYGRLFAGPAYIHNDHEWGGVDSQGFGIATQLDLGARFTRELAAHATLIADSSRSMALDGLIDGDQETTVLGLGLGGTTNWSGFSLGVSAGAQLTWHPDELNPNDGPEGAGLGPFISTTAGYVWSVSENLQLGGHVLARYRVGKDEQDPSGYQLGVGLSIGLVGDAFDEPAR